MRRVSNKAHFYAGVDRPSRSGLTAVHARIPLNMLQKWLDHAQLSTAAIHADAVGTENRRSQAAMWGCAQAAIASFAALKYHT